MPVTTRSLSWPQTLAVLVWLLAVWMVAMFQPSLFGAERLVANVGVFTKAGVAYVAGYLVGSRVWAQWTES